MAQGDLNNITLEQLETDKAVFRRVYSLLVWRCRKYFLYWGLNSDEGARGKQPEDIVSEAIASLYEPGSRYNPALGSLVGYLACNAIRGLVANLAKKRNVRLEGTVGDQEDWDTSQDYSEAMMEQHARLVVAQLSKAVEGDADAEAILLGRTERLSRSEIITEFGLDEKRYLNGYRRLQSKIARLDSGKLKSHLL